MANGFCSDTPSDQIHFKSLKSVKESTSFNKLQSLEKQFQFSEATINTKFFRKGVVGEWRQILSQKQAKQIEEELRIPMKELNYLK